MKKFKKIIFLACFVMLIAVMAIAVSAYDKTGNADVDLTKLPAGTTVNGETMSGTVSLPLYDLDGDALTYYLDGTNLVSIKTKKIAYVSNDNNKFLRLYRAGETDPAGNADTAITLANIVVLNFQDDTINALQSGVNNAGSRTQIKSSTSLQYIYFSDSTASIAIGDLFNGCTNLKGVYFGENSKLTAFASKTFGYCTSLTEVVLPPNLKEPKSAFMGCTGLKTITFPASVTTLWYTFSGCTSLEEVIFAEGSNLTIIDQQSFENCSKLTSLNIPDGVTKIGKSAFYGCSKLPSISLNNVTEIGELAFRNCTSLTELTLPNIKTIVQYAFKGCTGLTTVSIPSSALESLGIQIFMDCSSLKEVTFADVCSLETLSDSVFENCNVLESINIPNGITKIGAKAFYKCKSLKSITLPNSVTTIGFSSFGHCYALEYVNLGASVTTFETDGTNCNAFYSCSSLKTLIMPATIVFNGTEKQLFEKASKTIKFFFTGTQDQLNTLKAALANTTNNTVFTGIADTNIVKYDLDKGYNYYNSLDGAYIIYGYNKCEAFYNGNHTKSDAVLAYADGFDKSGTSTRTCPECGYTYESTTIDPIFTASGYSLGTDTGTMTGTMYAGFTVDTKALSAYNSYAGEGKELKYGIIVSNVSGDSITSVNFNDKKVITNENSIQIEITNYDFSRFGLTLTGFTDATKGLNIVMSAYVIDGDGNMSFVQQAAKTSLPDGVTSYYAKEVTVNGAEDKKLGAMSFDHITALGGTTVEEAATKENEATA